MKMSAQKLGLAVIALALLALFPVAVPNPYYIHLVETIMIYAIVLFGLDIVVGYTGQVDVVGVGHGHRKGGQRGQCQHGQAQFLSRRLHRGQTFLIADLPNSPAGLTASTSSSSTRPGTSL